MTAPMCRQLVINEENSGSPYQQWEKGIRMATHDWIWVAESDDIAHPDFLQKMNAMIEADRELTFIYSDSVILKEGTQENSTLPSSFKIWRNQLFQTDKWNHSYSATGISEINNALKWYCTINNASAAVFQKSKIEKLLHRLPEFKFHGDWFLYLASLLDGKMAYLPEELNWYREHTENFSKSASLNNPRRSEYFRILDYLLKKKQVSDRKQLLKHFIKHYIGFGLWRNRALFPAGIFWEYFSFNKRLACSVLLNIIGSKTSLKKL